MTEKNYVCRDLKLLKPFSQTNLLYILMEFPERFLCTYLKQSCAIHRTMFSIT